MNNTRLFDAVKYQLEKFPKENMLVSKQDKEWMPLSTAFVQQTVNKLSAGLLDLGVWGNDFTVESADKIAIIAQNCPEWLMIDIAVQQIGAILVPIYPTTGEKELAYILSEAEVKYVFVGNQALLNKYAETILHTASIKDIFSIETTSAKHWTTLLQPETTALLPQVEVIKESISDDNIATIIYTSGTTGTPKGVMLSHKNIVSCVMMAKESFPLPDDPSLRALSFLPLNHIFEKCLSYVYMFSGTSIYFAEGLDKIGDNIREIKPHIFTSVPRLLEKVFEKIMTAGMNLKGVKKRLFFDAVALARKYDNHKPFSRADKARLWLYNTLVFSKWRKALGGQIRYIITGGAACPESLLRIFNAAKIPVFEGYGPTECSPVISVNRFVNNQSLIGTVGPVINGLELKLEADGEICVKGPTVMKGYYKNQAMTNETIIDGWLHTGDIGRLVEGKYLKITDRKKELFKLSNGKYVAPQPIENKLKEDALIEQVMVVGAEQKYVAVLLVPSFSNLKKWMETHGLIFENNQQAINHVEAQKQYGRIIKKVNPLFNPTEQVKKFTLLAAEWSAEKGELTPKLSLKRKVVLANYQKEIAKMF